MKRNIQAEIKAIKHIVINTADGAVIAVKRAWLKFQLQQLVNRQAMLDTLLLEKTIEMRQIHRLHAEMTNDLAGKRTAMRTKLVRLEY